MPESKAAVPRLTESTVAGDPIEQFRRWLEEAIAAQIPQADAMTLATATRDGKPSARVVLLKGVDQEGFRFFTNYRSRKGRELGENPAAALVFYWEELGRQVRVEGRVLALAPEESDAYFAGRPFENRISSLASHQSRETTAEELDHRFEKLHQAYEGKAVPRPSWWGGYRVVPERLEFWQRHLARLNDRILYLRREGAGWRIVRLSP